jgi:acyl carrier protein
MTSADIPGWDSVAHINLMFTIESTFGIQFVGNELAELKNIGELKQYLAKKGLV